MEDTNELVLCGMQMIAAEDIGRQILTYGERYTANFHFNIILKKIHFNLNVLY